MNAERDTDDEFADAASSGEATTDDDRNLGALGDPAHPFDQTNDIVDGLGDDEGDVEEPGEDDDAVPPPTVFGR
jgi:hypothetical protein